MSGALPKLIAVVGTNASGKSSLAISLARSLGGEVISADSRQVYRGLDLGSGKVTAQEMQGVPHHLLDVCDPGTFFTMADFQRLAYRAIDDVLARGRVPVLAGGGGEGLGFMKLAYDPTTKTVTPVTAENGYRFLADQEGLVENQKVATALAPYNEELQAYLDQPLGTATGAFSNKNISLQPTALMDLLNKAQLSAVPAQLSICAPLTSGAEVRDLIPAGDIPMRLLYQLYVFENWLYRVNMTGEQLRLWLEHATTNYTSAWDPDYLGGGYYTDEIYGLYYEIHYYAPEGKRIQNMQYQGQPVAPDQVFSVVMNNYRFTGGAGFMQAAGLTPEDYSLTDMYTGDTLGNDNGQVRNILAQYIRDQKEITPTVESTWQFFRTKEDAIAAGAKVVE